MFLNNQHTGDTLSFPIVSSYCHIFVPCCVILLNVYGYILSLLSTMIVALRYKNSLAANSSFSSHRDTSHRQQTSSSGVGLRPSRPIGVPTWLSHPVEDLGPLPILAGSQQDLQHLRMLAYVSSIIHVLHFMLMQ